MQIGSTDTHQVAAIEATRQQVKEFGLLAKSKPRRSNPTQRMELHLAQPRNQGIALDRRALAQPLQEHGLGDRLVIVLLRFGLIWFGIGPSSTAKPQGRRRRADR